MGPQRLRADEYAGIRSTPRATARSAASAREPTVGVAAASLVILYSDELVASVTVVEAASGTVIEGIYEIQCGRRFLFTDNSGNVLAVWTPA